MDDDTLELDHLRGDHDWWLFQLSEAWHKCEFCQNEHAEYMRQQFASR
jgi:hypothetical protein